MIKTGKVTSSVVSVKKRLSKEKPSMPSGNKFWKKKACRTIEVPLHHAVEATETHLRALDIIRDDEDATLEFTPTMVKITITQGGVAKTTDG